MKYLVLAFTVLLSFNAASALDYPLGENSIFSDRATAERIAPVGKVVTSAEVAVSEVPAEPRSGEAVYGAACVACHGTGALNAPKLGDAADWGARKAQGMDALFDNAINGINMMPARGACADCSDDEIKAAVQYMLDNS